MGDKSQTPEFLLWKALTHRLLDLEEHFSGNKISACLLT